MPFATIADAVLGNLALALRIVGRPEDAEAVAREREAVHAQAPRPAGR